MYADSRTARAAVENARKLLQRRIPHERALAALVRLEAEIRAKGLHRPDHARNGHQSQPWRAAR